MKRFLSMLTLTVAAALLVLAQVSCTNPQDNQNTMTNAAAPEATPDKAAIEAELSKMEKDWARIIREHDGATVRRIEADDAVFVYPDGSLGNKEQDIKDIESGALSADSWEVTDLKVNVLDKDSAVVSGRTIVKGGKYKMPDGKIQDITGEFRFVDTYVRRNGQWFMVAGAATPVAAGAASPTTKASPSPTTSAAPKASPAAKASPVAKPSVTKPSPVAKPSPAKVAPAASPVKMKTPN
jgi:hypothetical protein